MKITLDWLEKYNACNLAIKQFKLQENRDEFFLIAKMIDNNKFNWANWYISRRLNKVRKVRYAIFAAELVLYLYEERYPNNNRPRKAIEAAKKYLNNPRKRTKADAAYAADAADAAYAAVYAAYDAVYAADAAYAAVYAAYAAAYAAVYAAYAAVYAAADAAYAAADAAYAAYAADIRKQIIEYGVKLIKEMEKK